ncbi:hypothetical protein [Streptomyces albireticuli]|uniref:hypothetical protein n=1 Tax=Streptomyces albireticuli TaxID=1940 RepID=UPI001331189A|nr:hypothetical protein [Streptomyces albireticuli]
MASRQQQSVLSSDAPGCLVFLGTARAQAAAIFATPSPGRVADPVIGRVQKLRAAVGAVTTFLMIWTYGVDGGWSEVFEDGITKVFLAPLILILVGPLVIGGFILYAPAEHRPLLRSRLRYPLKAVGWYLGIPVGAVTAAVGILFLARYLSDVSYVLGLLLYLVILVTGVPFAVWLVAFLAFASGAAARYAFNTADVHASLPAVLTAVLVWVLNLVSLGDGLPNGPLAVQLAAVLGGPLSVTAVSYWELHVLRTRYGVRIRG